MYYLCAAVAAKFKDGEKAKRGKANKNKAVTHRMRQTEKHQMEQRTTHLVVNGGGLVEKSLTDLRQAEGDGGGANAGMPLQGEHVLVVGVTDGHVSAGNNSAVNMYIV